MPTGQAHPVTSREWRAIRAFAPFVALWGGAEHVPRLRDVDAARLNLEGDPRYPGDLFVIQTRTCDGADPPIMIGRSRGRLRLISD
jgi:hypothetical protein